MGLLGGLGVVYEVGYLVRWNEEVCFPKKSLHSLKKGGTEGKQAALSTKSFSMLFQMPISIPLSWLRQSWPSFRKYTWMYLQSNLLIVGSPRRAVLETILTTANAKDLALRQSSFTGPTFGNSLRKPKAHQGHRTDFPHSWHLQTPDDNARIDGEGYVREG